MSTNSRANFVHFHLEEIRLIATQAVQNIGSLRPPRLYSAAVNGIWTSSCLCPERVFLTRIPLLTGCTPEDAAAAIIQFSLNLALNSSTSHHQFFFLESGAAAGDGGAPNYIPDLNVSPPDETAPAKEFVGVIKSQNISRLTDYAEEMAEYRKILSTKSEAEIGNLDSIRIWNILTLEAEIQNALITKGLVETLMLFDDLEFPPPQELLPIPEKGRKGAKKARYCGVFGLDEAKSPIPETADSDSSN